MLNNLYKTVTSTFLFQQINQFYIKHNIISLAVDIISISFMVVKYITAINVYIIHGCRVYYSNYIHYMNHQFCKLSPPDCVSSVAAPANPPWPKYPAGSENRLGENVSEKESSPCWEATLYLPKLPKESPKPNPPPPLLLKGSPAWALCGRGALLGLV